MDYIEDTSTITGVFHRDLMVEINEKNNIAMDNHRFFFFNLQINELNLKRPIFHGVSSMMLLVFYLEGKR